MNLTKPQKLIYDMEKFAGGSVAVICGSMLVHGKKDLSELKQAINEIYRLNDALRIRISETDGEVSQTITEYTGRNIRVLQFDSKEELDNYAENYAKAPLDFYGDLCEINIVILPKQYGILVKSHHIVSDAWSMVLICTQFNDLINGKSVEGYSYARYIESEKAYLESRWYERDKKYFLEQFKKCDEMTYLSDKKNDTLAACRTTFVINSEKKKQIINYAKKNRTSAFMLFTAAISAYMSRTKMNVEKFYIGTAILNRNGVKEKNTMGMFVNTVPVLIELDNTNSFAENLSEIQKTVFSIFRHQKHNYGDILSAIRKEYGFTEKLYDMMVSYQNAAIVGTEDIETTWYHSGIQSESLQIHIDDRDNEGVFRIHYDYQTEKFTRHEIEMLHQHICSLLFDALMNDNKKLYELEILTAEEKQKLLYGFNDTDVDYPKDKCVHQLFEKQVEKIPEKTAVIACDKTLTYKELNEEANCIAHSLMKRGIGVGDIVAFALPRKSYLISAILGILKSGAAYLPIDPDYPQDRIDYMIEDSKAELFITKSNIEELFINDNILNPNVDMCSENLCYCIYTSGSTGQPKGTLLKHKGIVNLVTNLDIYSDLSNCERFGFMTTITFDVATQEIFTDLLNGFTGVLMPERKKTSIDDIIDGIIQNQIDVMYATPTYFESLTNTLENTKKLLSAIKVVCLAGEKFFINNNTLNVKKHTNVIFENQYGPVELHVIATTTVLQNNDFDSIGKPVGNDKAYIIDSYMNPVPFGATGELCIAGDGVGAGYLNQPELTAEKFIDNPFGEGKLYKTGDLAYWREDGNIVYVGRNDFQVKIRGLRIELKEIENAVCSVPGISQAVIVVRKNAGGRQLICVFYTGIETGAKEIRAHIGKKLPKYMLPHIFTHLDEMPLTNSGKINRKALPEIDLENISNNAEYVAPENNLQKELCRLIELVLGTTPVGITDDFFDLGGDSLKVIEFVAKAHNEGLYFELQDVFEYPTVKALCDCIENGDKQNISFSDLDFTAVDKILAKNTAENITVPEKNDVGNILLAGATGYLGIHILADFLDNDNGIAYCIVRGKDKADSVARLKDLLHFYFGEKYNELYCIEVICADLRKDKFGLTEGEYKKLLSKAHMVINCAASVKHYGSYKYSYETNVETTKCLVGFCKAANAKLIHISTLSVSGNAFDNSESETEKHFYESSLYIGQSLDNVYVRSKFEAEKVVLDAMADGLKANIMRMGNLTNRLDGMFQKNYESNAFLKRIKAILAIKVLPDYLKEAPIEFTSVDEAARAVMTIARHFCMEQTVFHINNPKTVSMDKLMAYFGGLGHAVEFVADKTFTDALRKTMGQSDTEFIYEAFIGDMNFDDQLDYGSSICTQNEVTIQYLRQLGFEWPDIDLDYLQKYEAYFRKNGYWEV